MSAELDALGGGDTKVAQVEGYCIVHNNNNNNAIQDTILSMDYEKNIVTVRDPRASGSTPHAKGVRKYQVHSILPDPSHLNIVSENALNWLWDGFNCNIISLGQTGSGKSVSLWGRSDDIQESIFPQILESLFARIETSGERENYEVGISSWDILGNDVVDLFSENNTKSNNFGRKFGVHTSRGVNTIHTSSLSSSLSLLSLARSRSVNWTTASPANFPDTLPNRAHHAVRIVLRRREETDRKDREKRGRGEKEREKEREKGWEACLHVVDLVGHGRTPSHAKIVGHGDLERERRIARQQLVGFGRIIAELAKPPESKGESGPTLVSARDSVLSQFLGPLITTNCKTLILTCVSPNMEDFAETMHSLQFVKRAQSIVIGCAKTHIPNEVNMDFINENDVLTLDQVWPSQNGHRPTPPSGERTHASPRNHSRRMERETERERELDSEGRDENEEIEEREIHERERKKNLPKPYPQQQGGGKSQNQHHYNLQQLQHKQSQQQQQQQQHQQQLHQQHHQQQQQQQQRIHHQQQQHITKRSPRRSPRTGYEDELRVQDLQEDEEREREEREVVEGGFDVSEKRKRKQLLQAERDREQERENVNNRSTSSIKQKMKNVMSELDEERNVNTRNNKPMYNNNNNNNNNYQQTKTTQNGNYKNQNHSQTEEEEELEEENENEELEKFLRQPRTRSTISQGDLNPSVILAENVMLQKNYESVLAVLQREDSVKSRLAAQLAEAEAKVTEIQLVCNLQIDELADLQLRALVRRLEQSDFTEVFEIYERDMARIGLELKRLRDENLSLYDKIETFAEHASPSHSSSSSVRKGRLSASHASSVLSQELEEVKSESLRQERKHMLMQRALEETSKQLSSLGTACSNKDEQIRRMKDNESKLEAKIHSMAKENEGLRMAHRELAMQVENENSQIENLMIQLEHMREEYLLERKVEIINRVAPSTKDNRPERLRDKERDKEKEKGKVGIISQSISTLFDRLHELDMVDPKYSTLLKKLKKEFEKLEAEFAQKEVEQQKLISLCLENMPQTDSYMKNIGKFKEILGANAKVVSKMKASFQ